MSNRDQAVEVFKDAMSASTGVEGVAAIGALIEALREAPVPMASAAGELLEVHRGEAEGKLSFAVRGADSRHGYARVSCAGESELGELLALGLCLALHHPADLDEDVYGAYAAAAIGLFGEAEGLFVCDFCGNESLSYRDSLEHELTEHGESSPDPRPHLSN